MYVMIFLIFSNPFTVTSVQRQEIICIVPNRRAAKFLLLEGLRFLKTSRILFPIESWNFIKSDAQCPKKVIIHLIILLCSRYNSLVRLIWGEQTILLFFQLLWDNGLSVILLGSHFSVFFFVCFFYDIVFISILFLLLQK